jgi:hypothetical protein
MIKPRRIEEKMHEKIFLFLNLYIYIYVLHICGVASCSSSFLSELASFWVFRTYVQGIEENKNVPK